MGSKKFGGLKKNGFSMVREIKGSGNCSHI
jgi:hypothetical protein